MQLGYVGLGNMGRALARRLLRKDSARIYDLRPETILATPGSDANRTSFVHRPERKIGL